VINRGGVEVNSGGIDLGAIVRGTQFVESGGKATARVFILAERRVCSLRLVTKR
jgi:hypothetical protein